MKRSRFLKDLVGTYRRSKYFGISIVLAAILCANGLYITNRYNANPINSRSGLANSFTPGTFSGYYTIDPSDGYYAQALGYRVAADVVHGDLPWWNYDEGVGAPLVGGMQAAALFPLQFLLLFANGLFYFHLSLELIAAGATYILLRKLKLRKAAAVMGGVAFGLNGTFAWIGHTIFNPIAFLPVLILGIEYAVENARLGKKRGWLLITVAIAATLYAGFPETGFLDMILATLWALIRMAGLSKKQLIAYSKKLVGAGVAGLAIAAPILIAFLTYLPDANLGIHASSTADIILPTIGIAGLYIPYIYGPIFSYAGLDPILNSWWAVVGGYSSLSLGLLAPIGYIAARRDKKLRLMARALAIFIAVCICATYGFFWINKIVGHLPALSQIAFARYLPPVYNFALIILAASAISYLMGKIRPKQYGIFALITLLTGLALIFAAFLIGNPERQRLNLSIGARNWFIVSLLWALITVLLVTIAIFYGYRRWARVLLIGTCLLDVGIMFIIPMLSAPQSATINTKPVAFLRSHLGNSRFFALGPIAPNYGTYFGVASVNVNDIPQPKLYSNYITTKLNPNTNPITFTGNDSIDRTKITPTEAFLENIDNYKAIAVKYVVAPPMLLSSEQIANAHLLPVYHDETVKIFELPNSKPYFSAKACTLNDGASKDSVTSNCGRSTTLVRNEQYIGGWTAKIDGKPVVIGKYNDLLQKVTLPKGKHTVAFHYQPPHLTITYIFAFTALICVSALYLIPSKKPRTNT